MFNCNGRENSYYLVRGKSLVDLDLVNFDFGIVCLDVDNLDLDLWGENFVLMSIKGFLML